MEILAQKSTWKGLPAIIGKNGFHSMGLLEKFVSQEKREERKFEVKADRTMIRMEAIISKVSKIIQDEAKYEEALQNARKIRYSAKDVERFSVYLSTLHLTRDEFFSAGLVLSALIHEAPEKEVSVFSLPMSWEGLETPLCKIGYRNEKNLKVRGDVWSDLGKKMVAGKLLQEGNAGDNAGLDMEGGRLEITGNAGHYAGGAMKGGVILIHGDAGIHCTGWKMSGGLLHVKGEGGETIGLHVEGGVIWVEKLDIANQNERSRVSDRELPGMFFIKNSIICGGREETFHAERFAEYKSLGRIEMEQPSD